MESFFFFLWELITAKLYWSTLEFHRLIQLEPTFFLLCCVLVLSVSPRSLFSYLFFWLTVIQATDLVIWFKFVQENKQYEEVSTPVRGYLIVMLGTVRHSIWEPGEKVTLISNQYWVVYTELGRFTQLMWIGFVIAAVYSGELLSRRSGAGLTDTQKRFSAESYPPQRSLYVSENLLTHSSFSLCYSQPWHTHPRISWN